MTLILQQAEAISKPEKFVFLKKSVEIKNKVNITFNFVGTKKLKNINEKINVYSSNLTTLGKVIEKNLIKKSYLLAFHY